MSRLRLRLDVRLLASPAVRAAVVSAGIAFLAIEALRVFPAGEVVTTPLERRLEYWARAAGGLDPVIDERLKIIAFADGSRSALAESELSPDDWADLIDGLGRSGAASILIDKVFSVPLGRTPGGDRLARALAGPVPVAAGAFLAPRIEQRPALPLTRSEFAIPRGAAAPGDDGTTLAWLPILPNLVPYGPDAGLLAGLSGIGNLHYDSGYVRPLMRLGRDRAVPHLALLAAKTWSVDARGLFVDGRRLPLDQDGRTSVNLLPPARLRQRTYSLAFVLDAFRNGRRVDAARPGDVVLILPEMYTGGTDYKETPVGRIPGGYIVASVLNSVLGGAWLTRIEANGWALLLLCALGAFAGARLRPLHFAAAGLAGIGGGIIAGGAFFAVLGVQLDWLQLVLAFAGSGAASFFARVYRDEIRAQRFRGALSGLVSPARLKSLAERPGEAKLEAAEQIVTLVFIDVVGFSSAAESMTPREAFAQLKVLVAEIAGAVHDHGGTVDRTLGDGLLCYFGYDFGLSQQGSDHADQAVACAMAIQRRSLDRNLAASAANAPILPLRIGINTAGVFFGDLGDEWRIDFTAIGHGVNFAQRMEAACEPHRIMLSPSTWAAVTRLSQRSPLANKRLIQIKHHPEAFDAIEIDALGDRADDLKRVEAAYNRAQDLERGHERWQVPQSRPVVVRTPYRDGLLINYSTGGVAIRLDTYVAKGFALNLTIELPATGDLPSQHFELLGDVRWGRPHEKSFLHGVQIRGPDKAAFAVIVQALRAYCEAIAKTG